MSETPASDASFRAHERALWGLCYRLTGSAADADDVVQETFLRALERPPAAAGKVTRPRGEGAPVRCADGRSPPGELPRPWLVRVATNLSLDVLRRRRRRAYAGAWLPAPIETGGEAWDATGRGESAAGGEGGAGGDPEARYTRLESVSFAFLLALEALSPRQRAVLLFRDVLGYAARETAEVLGISEENVRITHHRARRAMRDYDRRRCIPTRALAVRTERALAELMRCLLAQDARGLERLLAESARVVTDGGGEYTALRAPIVGRGRVAAFHLRVAKRRGATARVELCVVNGLPALRLVFHDGRPRAAPRAVLRCELDAEGRIRELQAILASRKLAGVRFPAGRE